MSLFEQASLIVTPNAFKAGKLYSIKPTSGAGDLDVVRATTATRVNSAGLIESVANNIPRLDYTNGSCPSILVEPQRTNLALRSEEFDNASWSKSNATVTANSTISPDGTLNADLLIPTTANLFHIIAQSATMSNATTYQQTFFVKPEGYDYVQIYVAGGALAIGSRYINFDLSNGTIGTSDVLTGTITSFANGWYRISASATTVASGIGVMGLAVVQSSSATYRQAFTGNGTSGIYLWGAQLEAGSNATSYIPTVASAVTRNADVISKTGLTGITTITETFEDESTNIISGSPTSYTMSQGRIKQVIGI